MIMLILSSLFGCHNTANAQEDFDLSFDLDDTGQSTESLNSIMLTFTSKDCPRYVTQSVQTGVV